MNKKINERYALVGITFSCTVFLFWAALTFSNTIKNDCYFICENENNIKINIDSLTKINESMGLMNKKNPVSKEEREVILKSITKNDYGRIIDIYDTELKNIKEVYSPDGIYYVTSDGKYAFFGDMVDIEKNISKTGIDEMILKSQIKISDLSTVKFSRPNKITNLGNIADYKNDQIQINKEKEYKVEGLDKSIPSTSDTAKALSSEDLKHLSSQIINNDPNKTEKENVSLDEFKKRWKEKIESKMAKQVDKLSDENSKNYSAEDVAKTRVDVSEIQSGTAFLTYKGQKKSKIGFDNNGEKLSSEETKNQVMNLYKKLDDIGEKWSVVYPADGEEKIGVMVFSDPTCPYCQKLHSSIPKLNKAGVKVTILMYPRALGVEKSRPELAEKVMKSLHSAWCSPNPNEALDALYKGESIPMQDEACSIAKEQGRVDLPAAYQYFLGKLFNIQGTPLSFTSEGYMVRGFTNAEKYLDSIGLSKEDRNEPRTEITISGLESSDDK